MKKTSLEDNAEISSHLGGKNSSPLQPAPAFLPHIRRGDKNKKLTGD